MTWDQIAPIRWRELHTFCLRADSDTQGLEYTPAKVAAWTAWFSNRLECPACKVKWFAAVAAKPCPDSSRFAWSVDMHNDVNVSIGKPVMALDDARTHWEGFVTANPVPVAIAGKVAVAAAATGCSGCGKK